MSDDARFLLRKMRGRDNMNENSSSSSSREGQKQYTMIDRCCQAV